MIALLLAAWLTLARQPARALDVVLLVDVSDSLSLGNFTRDRSLLIAAGNAFADAVDAGDTARVGTFGGTLALDDAPLASAAAVRAAVARMAGHLGGPSPIWDALDAAARLLGSSAKRRAIVLVTDGRATGNRVGFSDAVVSLQRAQIVVAVISLDKSARPIPDPGARLEQLAKATGGTAVFVEKQALPAAIARAVNALRIPAATAR